MILNLYTKCWFPEVRFQNSQSKTPILDSQKDLLQGPPNRISEDVPTAQLKLDIQKQNIVHFNMIKHKTIHNKIHI